MGETRFDLTGFDGEAKNTSSSKFDLTGFDEDLKKKDVEESTESSTESTTTSEASDSEAQSTETEIYTGIKGYSDNNAQYTVQDGEWKIKRNGEWSSFPETSHLHHRLDEAYPEARTTQDLIQDDSDKDAKEPGFFGEIGIWMENTADKFAIFKGEAFKTVLGDDVLSLDVAAGNKAKDKLIKRKQEEAWAKEDSEIRNFKIQKSIIKDLSREGAIDKANNRILEIDNSINNLRDIDFLMKSKEYETSMSDSERVKKIDALRNERKYLKGGLEINDSAINNLSFDEHIATKATNNFTQKYNELLSKKEKLTSTISNLESKIPKFKESESDSSYNSYYDLRKTDRTLVEKKALERDKERLRATEKEIAELKLGYEKTISDSKAIHFSNKVYQVSGEDYTMMEVHDKLTNINTEVSRLDVKLGAATKKIKEFNKLNTESRIVTDKINADYETKAEELNKEYKEAANSAKTQEELDWVNSYYKNRHNILHSESVALFQEEIDKNKDVKSGYANYKKLLDERNSLAQQYESFTNTGIIEDTKEVSGLYDGWEGKMKAHNEEFSDVTAANLRKKKEQEKKKRGEEDFIRKYTTEGGLGVYTAGKRFLGGFIEAVPGLMQAATAGGYYGAFENFSDVLYEEAHNEFMTQSSKYNRGLVEDIARLEDGNEIVFDHKGQAIAVYGKDGYILSEKEQKQIIDEDKIARKKGEAPEISKGETNERILFNKFASTTGDMIGLIYGGSKFTKGVKALGVGSKAAQFTGLTISGFVAQTDDLFNEAVMSGMSRGNASKFALTTGVVLGALENISPNEAIWKGTAKKMAIKKALGFFKEKGVVGAGKHVTREFVKGLADENIQEISQTLAEKGIKYMTNQSMDENFFDTEVTMNEIKETAILTTMSTGTLQGRTAYQQIKNPSLIRQNALYNIMEEGKADDFIAQAKEKVETGEWTVEEGDIAIRTLNSAQLAWQDIPKKGNLSDRQKSALVYKMTQKYELEHDKSSNPLLNEMYDINMEMVDNDIKKIISGEYFEAKEGAQSVGYEMAEFVMKSKEDGGLGMTMDEFKAIQKKAEKEGVEKLDKDEKEVMTKYNKQLLDTTTREDTRFENMAKQNLKEQGIETPSSEQIYKEKQKVIKAENALYKSVISEAQEDKRTETELAKAKEEGREGIKGSTTITSKNLEEVDNLESQAITTSQKKALQQVKGVLGALKNIAPDIDIQIHATSQDMIDAAQSPNVEGNESGLFIDEDGSIHINMEKVRENTVAHEGVHPIIDAIKKHNPELHKQIESDLMKHIKETPELAKYLEFGEAYRKTKEEIEKDGKELGYTGDKLTEYVNEQIAENKETIPDETIVEFLADVASGKVKLPPKAKKSLWEKLKSLIKKYSSNYNLTEEEIDKMSFEKTLDVAQSIVGAVQTGQAFSLDSTTEAPKTSEKTESKKESKDKKDKKQIIGENAYLSKNVREGLLIAKIMHKHASLNTDKKAIKLKTGWEQGLDGKWRYEILDGKFKETVNFHGTKQKLSEVLYSPELFKAYPSMKDIEVILNVSVHGAERSLYKPEDRSIEINAKSKNAAFINLIHEIQHDIQFIEGFSKGGNDMSAMDGFLNNITPEIQAEWDNLLLKKKILGDITYLLENPMVVDLPPSEVFTNKFMNENKDVDGMLSVSPEDILDYLDKNPEFKKDLFIESTLEESFDVADIKRSEIIEELSFRFSPYSLYQRLSGEVEARNVENRSWMSIESKRKSLFQNTEDVAREDQILLDASELSKAPEAMKPVIEKSIRESFELGFITRLEQAEQLDELKLASPTEALKKDKKQVPKSTPMNFKTVDEFIKAQGTPVYHGGNAEVTELKDAVKSFYADSRGAMFASSDKQVANMFGKVTTELYPTMKNPYVFDAKKSNYYDIPIPKEFRNEVHESHKTIDTDSLVELVMEKGGHDGIILKNVIEGTGEFDPSDARVLHIGLTKDSFKTKQQLTDIWNKAHKSNPTKVDDGVLGQIGKADTKEALKKDKKQVTKSTPVFIDNAPEGVFLNIGLEEGERYGEQGKLYDEKIIKKFLPKDVKLKLKKIKKDSFENIGEDTAILELSRDLTDVEMDNLLKGTKQDAIPKLNNKEGVMYISPGVTVAVWMNFGAEYFAMNEKELLSNVKKIKPQKGRIELDRNLINIKNGISTEVKSQKPRPRKAGVDALHDDITPWLDIDADGNVNLIHIGVKNLEDGVIKPDFFGQNSYTSDAKNRGDKFSMFYVNPKDIEAMVNTFGKEIYHVKVNQSELYHFNTDRNRYYPEAEKNFREQFSSIEFEPNRQAQFIGELAVKDGFKGMIVNWGRGTKRVDMFTEVTPVKKQLAGKKGAEKLGVKGALDKAESLESEGKNVKEIRKETGWERGLDGEWKYEISDDKTTFIDFSTLEVGFSITLEEVLSNTDLFKAYPELKYLPFEMIHTGKDIKNEGGVYLGLQEGIAIILKKKSTEKLKNIPNAKQTLKAKSEMKDIILHEIQHAIQEIEGHEPGANLQMARDYIKINLKKENKKLKVLDKNVEALKNEADKAEEVGDKAIILETKDKLEEAIEYRRALLVPVYERFYGEMEANNVIERRKLSPKERLETPLSETRDKRKPIFTKKVRKQVTFNEGNVSDSKIIADKIDVSSLDRIPGGSTRDVYSYGDKVIKVAKSPKGIEQNNSLGFGDKNMLGSFIPEIYELGIDYVVYENIPRDDKAVNKWLKGIKRIYRENGLGRGGYPPSVLIEAMEGKGLSDFMNYNILWNDFFAARNWGRRDNGEFVLVDEGALNPGVTFNSTPAKWAKEEWENVKLLRKGKKVRKQVSRPKAQASGLKTKKVKKKISYTSNAEKGLGKINQPKGTPAQWIKQIAEKGGKGTTQEIKWMDLEGQLNAYQQENGVISIPKEVVEDILKRSNIQIEDVTLGDTTEKSKYQAYQLTGGKNYREILLTHPNLDNERQEQESKLKEFAEKMKAKYQTNQLMRHMLSPSERAELDKYGTPPPEIRYKSPHFDQKNIIAHVRLSDRTTPDGKKALHIEEVQSDWAQEGREKGFVSMAQAKERDKLREEIKVLNKELAKNKTEAEILEREQRPTVTNPSDIIKLNREAGYLENMLDEILFMSHKKLKDVRNNREFNEITKKIELIEKSVQGDSSKNLDEIYALMQAEVKIKSKIRVANERINSITIPKKDFKEAIPALAHQKTDQWGGLAVRRIIQEAIDGGYEVVSWSTGAQVQNIVGGEISGQEMFYNKILPKIMKDNAKRFDKNAKVEVIDFQESSVKDISKIKDELRAKSEEADDVWSVIVNTKNGQTAPTSIIQKYMRLINEVDSLEDVISFRKKSIGNQLSILITPEMKSSKGSKVVKFQRPGEKGKQDRKIIEGHLENKFSEEHYKKSDFLQEAKQGDLQGHGFTNKELERMWQDAALYARAKRIGEAVASKEINALLKSDFAEFYDDKQKKFKKQLNDLKNKLKNLKDATKAEKKAIKKEMDAVKEAFTEYINESGLINVGVTKKLLKLAQETNSVKDLVKFINTADKYIERQLKSDLKRVIRQTITSIRRRAANGEYTNVKDDVIDLTEIPFDSIQDETLLMEVVATLALVDRDKVAIVNESSIRELIAKVETHRHQESTLEDVITENELKEIDKLSEEKQKEELEDKIASQHNKVLDIVKRIAEMDLDSDNIGVNEELKAARKEIRKLQRIINKYHDITHGDLSNIEYIKNSLNTLLDIHNKKVESYNRNKYNLAMDIVNNLTKEELSRFDKHQINAIEELKDTEFINDLQLIDNLLAVSFDLSYGYIPLSAMNDIANASIRAKHSQDVLKAIDDAVRDKAEKGVKEREMTEDELTNKIRKKNWGYLDYIYGIKNNVIAKYLTPLITRAEAMMKLDIEGARDKFTNAVKKLKGGRSQVEKTMIKLGMIAHQNQENLNFDNPRDIWGDIFYPNGEKQAIYSKRYKDKEDIYREIYESLPKTEDGRVDVGEAMKELNTQERDVLSTFKEIMDNDLKGKQRFVNESNGQGFQDFDGYIPIIGKGKYSNSGNVIEDTSSWLEKIFKNPKIKSDRGKVRSDRKTKAIQADLGILFNDSVTQVNRDYHFTPAIQKLSSILNGALSTADKHNSTADHINALKETFKTGVQGLFHTTFKNDLFSKAVQKGFSFTYAYKLARIWKNFIGDFIADSVKMNIKGMNKYSAEILIRGAKERAYVNMKKIGKFLRLSTGNPANNLTTFDKLLNISKSPFLMRYNKHLIEGSTDIGSSTKGGLADFMMGFGDRNTVHMIWMPKFMSEFKKNTGEKFNYNKFNSDPSYAEKHKKAIKEASAVADSLSIQWKDTPVKTARRADIQLPFGTAVDINSQWAPFLTYMTNYGFQEAMQTAMGLSKMKYGLGNIFRGNFKEGRSETWEGFRELTAVTVTGVGYGIIIGVEYSLTMMSLAALSGDDDEYEKWRQKALDSVNGNAILKHIVSHFSFLLSSKYGQASRTMLLSFLGYIVKNKMVNKEQEEWINKKTRELFYSNPITWDKYGNLNYGVEAIAPPLAMFFDISSNLGDNFKNWLNLLKEQSEYMGDAEGVYRDADTEQGKYRPELKWTKLGFSIAQFWFITKGMKIPIQKEVERTINHFDKIYDKSSSAKRVKGEKVNPTTFPWTTPEPSDTKDEKGGTRKGSRKRTRSSKR